MTENIMKTAIRNFILVAVVALAATMLLPSCQTGSSYSSQKERERNAINSFISRKAVIKLGNDTLLNVGTINAISEEQFENQGDSTIIDPEKNINQYVYFSKTGVYMQIVRKGAGNYLKSDDNKQLMVRFWEYNILGDSIQLSNRILKYASNPEYINVSCYSNTITGSFDTKATTGSLMYTAYQSTSVPSGWLVPLSYVRIGRQTKADQGIAMVRLIVPHGQGQANASSNVYPCFYEMTFEESPKSAH